MVSGEREGRIYLGTSGYAYHHWKKIFYPEDLSSRKWLDYYASRFNAVEINVTFYRDLSEKTITNWYRSVPDEFTFVLKAPRLITHLKRLRNVEEDARYFLQKALLLKEKLGCVLWQFPPGFKPDPGVVAGFFGFLGELSPGLRHAVELRNREAFSEAVYDSLRKVNVSLVCAHSARYPCHIVQTADFSYFRFHGPGSLYNSCYSNEELDEWAVNILAASEKGDVFVFFNNDFSGFAIKNSLYLKEKLKSLVGEPQRNKRRT